MRSQLEWLFQRRRGTVSLTLKCYQLFMSKIILQPQDTAQILGQRSTIGVLRNEIISTMSTG